MAEGVEMGLRGLRGGWWRSMLCCSLRPLGRVLAEGVVVVCEGSVEGGGGER